MSFPTTRRLGPVLGQSCVTGVSRKTSKFDVLRLIDAAETIVVANFFRWSASRSGSLAGMQGWISPSPTSAAYSSVILVCDSQPQG